jgi:hypothetical protein
MAHEVFISYSSEDSSIANAICHFIEERGIRVWIAPRDIIPGLVWSEVIVDAISESTILVLVFSLNSNKSTQVKREIEIAVSREIIIIPFRIQDTPLSKSLEYFIGPHHWLDALTPPLEKHIETLVDKVEILLGGTAKSSEHQEMDYPGNPLTAEASRIAKKWAKSDYPYYILEGLSVDLKAMLRNPPKDMEDVNEDTALLLLMASIHFGGNWVKALNRCKDKYRATKLLFNALDISYVRPRLRALCALQACGHQEIKKLLNNTDIKLDESMRILIESYILTDTVKEYLISVKDESDSDLARKASEVLREYKQYNK